jgi:hypothetical protein
MNRRQKLPQHRPQNPAYRQAFEQLDEALAENTQVDNSETIRWMRQAAFADVEALEKTGKLKLPK